MNLPDEADEAFCPLFLHSHPSVPPVFHSSHSTNFPWWTVLDPGNSQKKNRVEFRINSLVESCKQVSKRLLNGGEENTGALRIRGDPSPAWEVGTDFWKRLYLGWTLKVRQKYLLFGFFLIDNRVTSKVSLPIPLPTPSFLSVFSFKQWRWLGTVNSASLYLNLIIFLILILFLSLPSSRLLSISKHIFYPQHYESKLQTSCQFSLK